VNFGSLYLIPALLSDENSVKLFAQANIEIIHTLDIFIVENIKTARRFLIKTGYPKPLENITFLLLDKHTTEDEKSGFLSELIFGKNIGLMSEAGLPCIADPGAEIVTFAHEKKIKVVPLPGPSSVFLALMASGFNGQNFAFHGYLPVEENKLKNMIRELELNIRNLDQTQIFIETPYRNNKLIKSLLRHCSHQTRLCIAANITGNNEFILAKSIDDWKKNIPDLNKQPAVFLLYR
jgi:16S rRNA (cytidine1402-2'-O)-methyltransferase